MEWSKVTFHHTRHHMIDSKDVLPDPLNRNTFPFLAQQNLCSKHRLGKHLSVTRQSAKIYLIIK